MGASSSLVRSAQARRGPQAGGPVVSWTVALWCWPDWSTQLTGTRSPTWWELIAVLSEVEPSGASNQITAGFLMASQRAIQGCFMGWIATLERVKRIELSS